MAAVHKPPAPPVVFSFPDTDRLKDSLASFIIKAQKESFEKKGKSRFTVALSGGSLPKMLSGLVGRPGVKWKNWSVPATYIPTYAADSGAQAGFLCR
jgi:6-phosphogluconolactonase